MDNEECSDHSVGKKIKCDIFYGKHINKILKCLKVACWCVLYSVDICGFPFLCYFRKVKA